MLQYYEVWLGTNTGTPTSRYTLNFVQKKKQYILVYVFFSPLGGGVKGWITLSLSNMLA